MRSLFEALKSIPGLFSKGPGFWIALFTIILLVARYLIYNHTDVPGRIKNTQYSNRTTPEKRNWNILSIAIFILFLLLIVAAFSH
jgi:hypothetical protein